MRHFLHILWFLIALPINAQVTESFVDNIQSLQVIVANDWTLMPVIELKDGAKLEISFDELSHDYKRFAYKIEHCEADWRVSDGMFENEYLNGNYNEFYIDDYEQSLNTQQLYTHYHFSLPNANVSFKVSGNYRVSIYDRDDDEKQPLAVAFFSISENTAPLSISATTNTEIDKNDLNQQLSIAVNFSQLRAQDPRRQFHLVVLQNGRWDNAVKNVEPTSVSPSSLLWEHSRQLIFKAGNEFRKMEMLNLHVPTMGVDKIRFFEPYYHFVLYPDKVRSNYVYDEDKNGSRYIRNDYSGADYGSETDYVITHFALEMPQRSDGDFYIYGKWTNGLFNDIYKMTYNHTTQTYENALLLKLGYYNYMYLFVPSNEHIGKTKPAEGDFYQTENEYDVYVYYRDLTGRYDRLVAYRTISYKP